MITAVFDSSEQRIITAKYRVRPLRLAFLVDPSNRAQVLRAMEICTCHWGGLLDPIIPVFRRRPGWLEGPDHDPAPSGHRLTAGWVEMFEPDYLVEVQPGLASEIGWPSDLVIPIDYTDAVGDDAGVGHGLSARSVYARAYERDFRFERRDPERVILCDPRLAMDSLWVATLFGRLPSTGPATPIRRDYLAALDANLQAVDGSNFADILISGRSVRTPIELTAWELRFRPRVQQLALYVLFNPSRPIDAAYIWSLRALGVRFWPIPAPYGAAFASSLAGAAMSGRLGPSDMEVSPIVSRAPTVSSAAADAFCAQLKAGGDHPLLHPHLNVAPLPVWDKLKLRNEHFERAEVYWKETEAEVVSRDGRIELTCPGPAFGEDSFGAGPQWATVVGLRDSRAASELAEVFPPKLGDVRQLLDGFATFNPVTASSEGLVVRCHLIDQRQYWRLVSGTDLFEFWLRSQGVEAEISSAGRSALELIRAIEGPGTAALVGHPDLVRIIGKAAENSAGSQVVPYAHLQEHLSRRYDGHQATVRRIAAWLTERVLQVQMDAECPACSQRNWYAPADLGNELRCARCLRVFPFPAGQPPNRTDWGYRPVGPFAEPGYARGAYTVALALRFFDNRDIGGGSQSWSVSLEDRREGKAFEVDFGLWIRPSRRKEGSPELVLGEAKTFNRFLAQDFERAEHLLERFQEAHVVFATLNESLDESERKGITRLAKRRANHSYRGRLILLTAIELCEQTALSATQAWKKRGGSFAHATEAYPDANHSLSVLSDATLDLHCDWRWQ